MVENIILEEIKDKEKYSKKSNFDKAMLENAIKDAIKKVDYAIETLDGKFPSHFTTDGMYDQVENTFGWNQGFWSGILWLSYELTGDDKYKEVALSQLPSWRKRIVDKLKVNHHDMGFLYIPSCVAAYKLTGSEEAKEIALMSADHLLGRWKEKGQFIQAWGELDDPASYRLIVDCLLNIPLLYWATEVTGDEKYKEIAYKHFKTTLTYAFREDGSSHHTFYFDPETGAPLKGVTAQGFSDTSCWSRGQAWAIYGPILTYKYVKDPEILEVCKKVVNYYLNRMPEDYVAYWDLIFTDGDGEPRDSSSSAIAICGMMEICKYLPDDDPDKALYENAIKLIIESLYQNYSTKDTEKANSLLLHGTGGKPQGQGIDESNTWGCYFYLEALTRMYKDWELYW